MRYGIRLCSKYSGESIILGSSFKTMKERESYIKRYICKRCNRVELVYISDGAQYVNKYIGFATRLEREMIYSGPPTAEKYDPRIKYIRRAIPRDKSEL